MGHASCGIHEALWLARLHASGVHALYLHLPFCRRKCAYCDFASAATDATDPLVGAYLASLERQLAALGEVGLLARCETAYVGGGTPSLVGARLARLVRRVRATAPAIRELSCEANPDSLGNGLAGALADAGCTRLSVGVQSLSDKELAALGRIHTAAQARDRLRVAVAAGLDVSADLMCALPGQTTQSWASTLAGVMDCGVGHVSVYPLQIEEGTPFGERYADDMPPWNDPDLQAAYMEQAQDTLEAGGFARYEVASYARPGKTCAHNLSYWSGQTYLGLGTRASSMLSREAYERLRTVAHQLPEFGGRVRRVRLTCAADACTVAKAGDIASLPFSLELLDEAQAAAEDLMLGMRMTTGVDMGLLEHARKVLGEGRVDDTLLSCVRRGLVSCDGGRFAPTHVGWLRGNELFGALWELAPGRVEELEVPQRS